ncbi:PilW family protein [Geobacter sp. AOG2]|uniref:PilW family protein n=1 Tax=Geobacter sp. AOG2 TaxID=1566347 RepID=UPI001CC6D6F3|nr:prepilin-type N-terminal cleavage/methylation domain-containing protein [Geobacter sp. AOG2]GFE61358.1 type IV pilus minor pilin PilW [Geobacter sp. AOG2]
MLNSRKGFTLVELIVVMAVFTVVIMIAGDSFKTILNQMGKITKSEESNIEGVLGLEMFRHDLQQAGYGLPFSYLAPITYYEAGYAPASAYNDGTGTTASGVPRAIVAGDTLAATTASDGTDSYNILAGTDYLALKGATLGLTKAAQNWTYMPYSSGITGKKKPRIWQKDNLANTDRVIVLKKTFSGSTYTNQLIFNTAHPETYWANYNSGGFADTSFNPTLPEEMYYIYGISADDNVGMPFNRADYFVASPADSTKKPSYCSPDSGGVPTTGILYKGSLNHSSSAPGGHLTYIPLLDCVADMQVVFGWDVDDGQGSEGQDGVVETFSTPLASGGAITVSPAGNMGRVTSALADPEKLRNSLKVVKVYVLAQVGRRDANYQSPATFEIGDPTLDNSISKTFTLSAAMRNYHWKVYRLIVRPKNLLTNQ